MAYSQHTWTTGEPITQERMNHIEQGIGAIDSTASEAQSTATTAKQNVSSLSEQVEGVSDTASRALRIAEQARQDTAAGTNAWTQIKGVITIDPNTNTVSKSLSQVINGITDALASTDSIAKKARDDISSAIQTSNFGDATVSTFKGKIENIIAQVNTNKEQIGSVVSEISTARSRSGREPFLNLQARMNSEYTEFSDFKTSIEDAYKSAAYSQDYTTLDARLEADENRIIDLNNSALKPEMIVNDFSSNDATKVLSAAAGRTLRNLIGGTYDAENTVTKAINTALSDAKTYADDNKVAKTDVYNDLDYTADDKYVLDARQGKALNDRLVPVETALEDALASTVLDHEYESLDERLEAIESDKKDIKDEVIAARTSSVVRTPGENDGDPDTDTTYANLDARLEAIESHAAAVRTDVNTIANELAMVDNDNIVNTNTRVDTLENDLRTMAAELDMLDGTAIKDTNTRIDSIEGEINAAHRTNDDTLNARFSAVESSVSGLNSTITNAETGLAKTKEIADEALDKANKAAVATEVTSALAGKASTQSVSDLSDRVTTLEESGTVVIDNVTYDNDGNPSNIGTTPSPDVDYLLKKGDKYYYWKYIPNNTDPVTYTWALISGGSSEGGGGTSSAQIVATLPAAEAADINTDYYVGNNNDGYLHYRFITVEGNLRSILIGTNPTNIKRYNITKTQGKKKVYDETTQTWQTTDDDCYYLNLYEFGYGESNAAEGIDDEVMQPLAQIELPEGGGGGSTVTTTPRVVRITPSNLTTVLNENHIYLRFFYSSVDATGETHDGSYTLRYNGGSIIDSGTLVSGPYDTTVTTGVWPENPGLGFYQIDVTEYCRLGTQTFNLNVVTNGQTIPRIWNITIQELRLESSAPESQLIEAGNSIQFPYVPFGTMTKTLFVEIDGVDRPELRQSIGGAISGSPQELAIPAQAHGAHTISIYLKAELNGQEVTTDTITRDYIWYDAEDEDVADVIIASPYRGKSITVEQYEQLDIPYTIYNRLSSTSAVNYYEGDTLLDTVTVTNNGIFSYAFETFGNKTVRIAVGETSLSFNVIVTESSADIAPVTGAVINFDPTSLTNNSVNRLPTWTYNNQTYHMTVSDNFNWANDISGGGYKEDVDGKCFVIKAGTYAEIDYKMFKQAVDNTDPENPVFTSSVFDKGAEMKITFKVAAVRDASAVWFSNVGNPSSTNQMPIGIQLSAHQGWLKTSAADAAEKQAALEGTTVSTNSYLYFPYSEEDKIELDISINKSGNSEDFIMSYEDGVPSKAYSYETSEILYHEAGNESVIRIGSPDCDVYIYKLRIYDKALNTSEILRNFIADGKTIIEKVNRYNRNSIYYDSTKPEGKRFTPYKIGNAILDPEQLAKKMPDVKILMLEAPTFTKSKKTFVKSSLRCIHAEGGTIYPSRGDEDNWLFRNGYHSGQGTTSDNYGQSSRNVDFLFECDGINRPSDKVEAESNYVSNLIKGADKSVLNPTTKSWTPTVDAVVEMCSGWKKNDAKVSLTATSVPNNYFNLKVNVASSENVNNALFQKRYNDFLPYISPAKARDSRVKNDMEFVPAILFIRETDTTKDENGNYTKHLEFNDTEWHFYSLGNIGDSKKTDYTRAYYPDDENEFTVEISDNNTPNSQFQSGVYISNDERIVETSDSGINSMNYIWDITDEEWNAQRDPTEKEIDHDYRVDEEIEKYEDGTDVENNLTHYILPNGKVYVNYRHRMLSGDPFDGDHTFEFRYASCGDYRDGKIVNPKKDDSDPERAARYKQIKAQDKRNRAIIEAFYEWIITASNSEFVNELAEWCVPEALEYFYAFTHFYTMMDNRAKNTFWHFAKTGIPRQVHHPHPALLHVYTELKNGEYVPTEDTEIDPEKTYYTEYAFDLWAYDMDTAAGIDNNGELIFPYGKEDTDYRQAGVSSSGYVFNGAGSIIWRRLSQSFTSEIANIFDRVNEASCFDAASLITQFDNFQNCYPEEMWRLDIERKYIRTFTGKVYDNCKLTDTDGNTKQNTRFLKEMMQGRKKYQRRQWVRDQGIYFGSKYMLSNVRNNTIEMVCYTPDAPLWNSRGYTYQEDGTDRYRAFQPGDFTFYGPENNRKLYKCLVGNTDSTFDVTKWAEGVTPDYQLKIVPYQDMYINVAVGNGNLRTPQRAVAGQEYTIDCTANMNETRIYIYAGSYIQALSNLAPFYIGANIFSSAARLKKLDLGTDNPTYHNTNLNSLTILPNMPILEELNIKNCDNLNTPINLSGSNNLRIVEAEGSIIPSLSLPAYTSIETLHLPSTINILSLQSARHLTDFYMKNKTTGLEDYTSLINMNITDSDYSTNINWINIALAALPHLNTLYLQSLRNSSIGNITELEPFAEKKAEIETQYDDYGNLINKLNLSGIINVTGSWSTIEKSQYGAPNGIWPNLEFNTIAENEQTKCKVTYYHSGYWKNGIYVEPTVITTQFITVGDVVPDIYEGRPKSELPYREPTVESIFTFGGYDENTNYMPYTGWTKNANESTAEPLGDINGNGNSANNRLRVSINDGNELNLYTYYSKSKHKYTVRWLLDNEVISTRANQDYGEGYDLEAPTVAQMRQNGKTLVKDFKFNNNGTVSYKIFDGWSKLPTNISPTEAEALTSNYDITAVWKEVTKTLDDNDPNSVFYDTSNITAEQLLVLAHMNSVDRAGKALTIVPQKTFTYQMGYDSKITGTELFSNVRLTTNNYSNNEIAPFAQKVNDKGFTIAIDYQFGIATNSTYPEVLVGCYAKDNTGSNITGFALYRGYDSARGGTGINVCYNISPNNNNSTQRKNIGDASHRNIIVLRRPKNQNTLYIYSARSNNATTSLNTNIQIESIPLASSIVFNDDAKICIGKLRSDLDDNNLYSSSEGNNTRSAQGSIYWLKYWDEDLGAGECKSLAAWPHERMTAMIVAQNSTATNESDKLNLFMHNLNGSSHMNVWQNRFVEGNQEAEKGWDTSIMRDICIQRIFPGLPIELQTIINAPRIGYYRYHRTQGSDGNSLITLGEVYSDQGFVYPPSVSSINYTQYARYAAESIIERTGANRETTSDITPYIWTGTAATRIIAYEPASYTSQQITWNSISASNNWLNIRFNEWPLLTTTPMRVFVIKSGKLTPTYYSAINDSVNDNGEPIAIQQNDIVIDVSDDNIVQGVYMYMNSTTQNTYAIQTKPQEPNSKFITGTDTGRVGGWIQSVPYVTRSATDESGTYPNFIYIKVDGTVLSPSGNGDTSSIQGLQTIDFSFAI